MYDTYSSKIVSFDICGLDYFTMNVLYFMNSSISRSLWIKQWKWIHAIVIGHVQFVFPSLNRPLFSMSEGKFSYSAKPYCCCLE